MAEKWKNPRTKLDPPREATTTPGKQAADEGRVHAPGSTLLSNAK